MTKREEPTPETLRMAEELADRLTNTYLFWPNHQDKRPVDNPEGLKVLSGILAQALTEAMQGMREAGLEESIKACQKLHARWKCAGGFESMAVAAVNCINEIENLKPKLPASQGTDGAELNDLARETADKICNMISGNGMLDFVEMSRQAIADDIMAALFRAKEQR